MITQLSIDILLHKIQDARTREYFDEVLSCYYSGNYRSAIVMLYGVVMCDLIYKLQSLNDIYHDTTAKNILDEIDRQQTANPTSPAWENYIRDELVKCRRILTPVEASHLEALQKDRHLCAHPVLKNNAELHRPTQASVYAHIINSLSEILTRPALLEKELLSSILTDLAKQRRFIQRPEEGNRYIISRHLSKIDNPEIEVRLFGKLWKIVFQLTDVLPAKNRGINLHLLNLLFSRNEAEATALMKAESEKLSQQIELSDPVILEHFVKFVNLHPSVYEALDEAFKTSFNARIRQIPLLRQICFFLHKDINAYYADLLNELTSDSDIRYIMNFITGWLSRAEALEIPIALFANSDSFTDANENYDSFISPHLKEFSLEHLTKILDSIASNGQIRHAYRVQNCIPNLVKKIKTKNQDFDFSQYDFIK